MIYLLLSGRNKKRKKAGMFLPIIINLKNKKMKKNIFSFVALLTVSAGYVGYSVYGDIQNPNLENFYLGDVEALATGGESGGVFISCHCKPGVPNNCGSDNTGSQCAGGENILCANYASNCTGAK